MNKNSKLFIAIIIVCTMLLPFNVYGYNANINDEWYYKPCNYNELVSWYVALEEDYPNYIDVFKANEMYNTGRANGGYDLYYVRITNESLGLHKPEVLFLGSPHGDETAGTIGLYWFTDWLMRMAFTDEQCPDYSKDWLRWLIDHREIYIEVSHNPYGFDNVQRYDKNGWDLNREADYDGPGQPTGGIWGSVSGKTLVRFVNNHTIRVGCDFHDGTRMLLYPWSSNHDNVYGTSPITNRTYSHAPPDLYYFDADATRLGNYIGDFGGDLNKYNIGTIPDTVGYEAPGAISPWAYGANIERHPVEDPYVEGNYPGTGVLWVTPEVSKIKNPSEASFGNDTVSGYGAEIRRFVLHQTDIAQPYVQWLCNTTSQRVLISANITLRWQVNGSLVVDHTFIQWGTDTDPINHSQYFTSDYNEYDGRYLGGTGWDNADNGCTDGVVYEENITFTELGEYYLVAKAQVDQIYSSILYPEVYGSDSYLRLVKERTDVSYYETIDGSDGIEEIDGQIWWYSPIIHVTVYENNPPVKPEPPDGPTHGIEGVEYSYRTSTTDSDGDQIYYLFDWGDNTNSSWLGHYESGITIQANKTWNQSGTYLVKAKAKDSNGGISKWSNSLNVVIDNNEHPLVEITSPKKGIYIKNREIFPFFATVIIGDIDIKVTATDADGIDRVDFYVDGDLKDSDYISPYIWAWNATVSGLRHAITVVATDTYGGQASNRLVVWYLELNYE